MMMRMPALRMRDRDPAEHLGAFAILLLPRPDEEMPMIGHEAIGCDANLCLSGIYRVALRRVYRGVRCTER